MKRNETKRNYIHHGTHDMKRNQGDGSVDQPIVSPKKITKIQAGMITTMIINFNRSIFSRTIQRIACSLAHSLIWNQLTVKEAGE